MTDPVVNQSYGFVCNCGAFVSAGMSHTCAIRHNGTIERNWHLTEPVRCASCGAVSVNGGTLHCHGCYKKLSHPSIDVSGIREVISAMRDLLAVAGDAAGTPRIRRWADRLDRALKGEK